MDNYSEIARIIKEMAGTVQVIMFTAEVVSVEGDTCTISVEGLDVPDVLLTPADDGKEGKLTITPKVGSIVTVADLSGGTMRRMAVVQWGEVERINCTCEQIELNGGENGGLVNIESLKNNLDALKKYVEAMKNAIGAGFTSVGASTAANGAFGKQAFDAQMASQNINFEDMEDAAITH